MNRLAIDNGSAGRCASTERTAALRHGHRSVRRHMLKDVAIDPIDQDVGRVAQPGGAFDERVKHRLQFGPRAGNGAENFACGRLLLGSFGEVTLASFELLGDAL